jgi:hypothetical protein
MAKVIIDVSMEKTKLRDVIEERTYQFCQEYPEVVRRASFKEPGKLSPPNIFRKLSDDIIKDVEHGCITKCPRCGKHTRADILHTCSPGDWKPIKVVPCKALPATKRVVTGDGKGNTSETEIKPHVVV